MRLYKVELSNGGWDSFDSAVIGCESKEILEAFFKDGVFDSYDSGDAIVEYQQRFYLREFQTVTSIEGIGYTEHATDKKAIVFVSSFNAG